MNHDLLPLSHTPCVQRAHLWVKISLGKGGFGGILFIDRAFIVERVSISKSPPMGAPTFWVGKTPKATGFAGGFFSLVFILDSIEGLCFIAKDSTIRHHNALLVAI